MGKLTPYDKAVRKAQDRNTRLCRYEERRHADKINENDLKLKHDLIQATLLPGSVRVHDDATVIHRIMDGQTDTIMTGVRFNEFCRDNDFTPEEIECFRQKLADGKRPRGGGGAAPIWEIWI